MGRSSPPAASAKQFHSPTTSSRRLTRSRTGILPVPTMTGKMPVLLHQLRQVLDRQRAVTQHGLVKLTQIEFVAPLPLNVLPQPVKRGAADEVRGKLSAALLRPRDLAHRLGFR